MKNQKHCALPGCDNPIPGTRKKNAKYCCDEHYYTAKVQRSLDTYKKNTAPAKELRRNEKILDRLYVFAELKKEIFSSYLDALSFNWGCSSEERANEKNQIFKIVGSFAYYLDPLTQRVTLCKWNLKK